jgi:hypothetical protein
MQQPLALGLGQHFAEPRFGASGLSESDYVQLWHHLTMLHGSFRNFPLAAIG